MAETEPTIKNSQRPFELGTVDFLMYIHGTLGEHEMPDKGTSATVLNNLASMFDGTATPEISKQYGDLKQASLILQEKYLQGEERVQFQDMPLGEKLKAAIAVNSLLRSTSRASEKIKEDFEETPRESQLEFLVELARREEFKTYANNFSVAVTLGDMDKLRAYGFSSKEEADILHDEIIDAVHADLLSSRIEARKQKYITEVGYPEPKAEESARKSVLKAYRGLKLFDRLYPEGSPKRQEVLKLMGYKPQPAEVIEIPETQGMLDLLAA